MSVALLFAVSCALTVLMAFAMVCTVMAAFCAAASRLFWRVDEPLGKALLLMGMLFLYLACHMVHP